MSRLAEPPSRILSFSHGLGLDPRAFRTVRRSVVGGSADIGCAHRHRAPCRASRTQDTQTSGAGRQSKWLSRQRARPPAPPAMLHFAAGSDRSGACRADRLRCGSSPSGVPQKTRARIPDCRGSARRTDGAGDLAVELTNHAIARIESLDSRIKAVVMRDFERARAGRVINIWALRRNGRTSGGGAPRIPTSSNLWTRRRYRPRWSASSRRACSWRWPPSRARAAPRQDVSGRASEELVHFGLLGGQLEGSRCRGRRWPLVS